MNTALHNRIDQSLTEQATQRGHAVLPFLTAGYPNADTTVQLIRALDDEGARVIELGFPFSDSIADGPVIQSSFHQAIASGHDVASVFDMALAVREQRQCGLVAMVSYSIIERFSASAFLDRAAESGFDGMIVPDAPMDVAITFGEQCRAAGLHMIGLIAPTTPPERSLDIANYSSGFLYQIAANGTTGERQTVVASLEAQVKQLKASHGVPVCVGFGVSSSSQVRDICHYADGAIVGSAIVRRIASCLDKQFSQAAIIKEVSSFVRSLISASPPT